MKRFTTIATLAVCCALALQAAPALAGNKSLMKKAMLPRSTGSGAKVSSAPIVRDHRSGTEQLNTVAGGVKVTSSSKPIVRDHRAKNGLLDALGGNTTPTATADSPIVRDHRGQAGPIIRDHRKTPTPFSPTGGVVVDPVFPPKGPTDGVRPPFGGVYDPGTGGGIVVDPVRPPKGPTDGIRPPFGGGVFDPGTGSGTTPPPSQPDSAQPADAADLPALERRLLRPRQRVQQRWLPLVGFGQRIVQRWILRWLVRGTVLCRTGLRRAIRVGK